jgi:hypothetical protein
MKAHDLSEENLRHRLCRAHVCEGGEVAVLAEMIHHHEDDGLPAYTWQCLTKSSPMSVQTIVGTGRGRSRPAGVDGPTCSVGMWHRRVRSPGPLAGGWGSESHGGDGAEYVGRLRGRRCARRR